MIAITPFQEPTTIYSPYKERGGGGKVTNANLSLHTCVSILIFRQLSFLKVGESNNQAL
jgi:hypothetical protein